MRVFASLRVVTMMLSGKTLGFGSNFVKMHSGT
jgi:hypothetical protein